MDGAAAIDGDTASPFPLETPATAGFPRVSYSTLSTDFVVDLVAEGYGIDSAAECVLIQRGMNDTYFVPAGRENFALRVGRSNVRTRDHLLTELRILRHAGAKGVDVAQPVVRRDGAWITEVPAPEGMRQAVLFRWAEGWAPEGTDLSQARQFGLSVARFHTVCDQLRLNTKLSGGNPEQLLLDSVDLIRPRAVDYDSIRSGLDNLTDRVLVRLAEAQAHLNDWGILHGDVHAGNARTDGNHLFLFDLDCCALGWRVYDLATFRWSERMRGQEQSAWPAFAEGYLHERPAAEQSLRAVPIFMIVRHLWWVAQLILLCRDAGRAFVTEETLLQMVPFCEAIELEICNA